MLRRRAYGVFLALRAAGSSSAETSSSMQTVLSRSVCPMQLGPHAAHSTPVAASSTRAALAGSVQLWGCAASRCMSTQAPEEAKLMVHRTLLVDTLAVARRLEAAGMPRQAAEELSEHITELIVVNKCKMEDTFVKKQDLDKIILQQEARAMSMHGDLQKTQDLQAASVNKDLERQTSFLEKTRTEVRHEIDKLTASQRLDMNLEKGRIRDDLQAMRDKVTELEIKVDRDINELRSSVEKAKNDTIKFVLTIMGTFAAIALTISRFMQMGSGGG